MTDHPFPITPELYLDLWYEALKREIGIVVPISNPQDTISIMNAMYTARKDINDPRLAAVCIHIPEDASAIYVYKKEVELDD